MLERVRAALPAAGIVLTAVGTIVAIGAASASALPQLPEPADPPAHEPERPDRLIVHLAEPSRDAQPPAQVAAAAASGGLEERRRVAQLDAVVYEVPGGDVDEAAERLAATPGVADVEQDATATVTAVEPDDPLYADHQWGLRQIDGPGAWTHTTGSAHVTIAVLDTGVNAEHEDLADAVDVDGGANFTEEGDADDTSDRNGHGTMSAGVAAARSDNSLGMAGTCWDCEILPVKVMGADGLGRASDIAAGITYAVDEGADVLNLSLGATADVSVLRQAVEYAAANDVVAVASAGNFGDAEGTQGEDEVYPAAYDEALGVAATDPDDERYHFSSFGDWVEVAAPGCNPATHAEGDYQWYCGTSSSAPLVSGVAGLAVDAEPDAGGDQIIDAVTDTAVEVGDFVVFGRVDAHATLQALPEGEADEEPDAGEPPEAEEPPEGEPDEEIESRPGRELIRVSGSQRFDTAARLARQRFEPGVSRVYVATGTDFADALAAGTSAGEAQGPVLLATRTTLPGDTAEALRSLEPDEVIVVGGSQAVSDGVAGEIRSVADAPTRRIAGGDRFDTAARLATDSFHAGASIAYVATGGGFADALAGVPAAIEEGAPMLLTAREQLPGVTREALRTLAPDRIVVLGGTGAVSAGVEAELGELAGHVVRRAGDGRFETAAAVSRAVFDEELDAAYLATGFDFPDALAGGPAAGLDGGPLLLATRDQLPAATAEELRRTQPIDNLTLGGRSVISDDVQATAGEASAAEVD